MRMRAKLRVTSVESFGSSERVKMTAVSKSTSYPEDGADEDNTYAKFSPSATFEIMIANPALLGVYHAEDLLYVDFTPVPAPAPAPAAE